MRAERPLLLAGGLLCLATLAAALVEPRAVLTGWLAAAIAVGSIPAGALALLMAMRLVPGAWGEGMRLSAEAATTLISAAGLLFLPVVAGLWWIYPWASTQLPGLKGFVHTPAAFILVTLARFAALILLARAMQARRRTTTTAALGLCLLALLEYAVAVEWLMALDPAHPSASIGLQFVLRELVIAWSVLLLLRLSIGRPPARTGVLGGVLLALLLAWAYLIVMAFLVGWSSNLPEHVGWYAARAGGWDAAEIAFAMLSAAPAAALLLSRIRRSPLAVRRCAALALLGQLTELAWAALPGTGAAGTLAYLAALAGLTAITTALLPRALRRRIEARAP